MDPERLCTFCNRTCSIVQHDSTLVYKCNDCSKTKPIQSGAILVRYETTKQRNTPYAHSNSSSMTWGSDCIQTKKV